MELFKKFVSYYKPFKLLFIADMTCALILSGIDLAFPKILDYLTEDIFMRSSEEIMDVLLYIAIVLIAMYLIKYACQYFITSWGHIMGARMENNMRRDLFDHYQKLSFSFYDKNNTGEMMSKITNDLFDVTELAHHGPENIVIAAIKLIGSFTILMFMNVPMTLLLIAICVVMFIYTFHKNKEMRRLFMENRKKTAGINSAVQDSLAGIRVVKSFTGEEVERRKFHKSNTAYLKTK